MAVASHRPGARHGFVAACVATAMLLSLAAEAAAAPSVRWTRQFGPNDSGSASAVAVDGRGRSFVVGSVRGDFAGHPPTGNDDDAFVRKHAPGGRHIWTRQFGTAGDETAFGVAVDRDGNVYIVGTTQGDFGDPGAGPGDEDVYVRSYSQRGDHRWTRQFGTSADDRGRAVAVDGDGNVYVAGETDGDLAASNEGDEDAFIRKYSRNGQHRWTRQFGVFLQMGVFGVAVDRFGDVSVVGDTQGVLQGSGNGDWDAWVRKFGPRGGVIWTRQFGTSEGDGAEGVSVDRSGAVLVAGTTSGEFPGQTPGGGADAFIRKLRRDGRHLWTRQLGSSDTDFGTSVDTDPSGNVFLGGNTYGELPGQDQLGDSDAFVRKYEPNGRGRWIRQFGTVEQDGTNGVGVDGRGRIYLAGNTNGDLTGENDPGEGFLRSMAQ